MMAIVATFSLPAQALEKPEYSVLYEDGKFEYRLYQPYIVAETEMVGMDDSSEASNEGFRRLFDYISGANSAESKVAMTAPVQQSRIDSSEKIAMTAPVQQFETETGWRVGFMLPGKYSMVNAPVPSDDRVYLRLIPARTMAVVRYSGRWTERNLQKQQARLLQRVEADGLTIQSSLESAFYNPPFMPPFMRRNEIMVEVQGLPESLSDALSANASR